MGGHLSLHQSVRQGAAETLRTTCARIRDVNVTESVEGVQWTAVQFAAWVGNPEAIEILVEHGANVNFADADGSTALHLASTRGFVDTVRTLLDVGAHVNAADKHGMTPLHRASIEGQDEVVKLLCRRLANVNSPDKQGATPLHLACFEGHLIVVYLLIEAGASVLVVDHNGNTPLHDAASGGHSVIMHRLVMHGAQVGLRNGNNVTAEEILDAKQTQVVGIDIEDSQSTTNTTATMPATPPRVPSSHIDACSLSGTTDEDVSVGEVTSHWKGNPLQEEETEVIPGDRESHFEPSLDKMEIDQEPQPPSEDLPLHLSALRRDAL